MGNETTIVRCHIDHVDRLKGKTVTVFTIDGNLVRGEVLETNTNSTAIYVKENEGQTRMIMASAIASISMSMDDAKLIMALEKPTILSIP